MDFFNALSQVSHNKEHFKQWEQEQHREVAQREKLAAVHKHTPEEIAQAKELGKNIIDVIDIMDNHSESVAENVETAISPLTGAVTTGVAVGGIALVNKFSTPKLLNKKREIIKTAKKSEEYINLKQRVSEYCKNKKSPITNILNKNETSKIKDFELKKDLSVLQQKINGKTKKINYKIYGNQGLVLLATLGAFIATTIWGAKIQTDSSKIARYQARKELNDPKEFVNYTPEQIEAAQKELNAHPELIKQDKKSGLKQGFFKSIHGILRDRRAYLKDKDLRNSNPQKITRPLTKAEIDQAERDKDVIQRTVRIINNEAEKNSENMEVAANVIIGATPVLGAAVGGVTGWILNKLKVFDKFIDKTLDKECLEDTKKLYEEFKKTKKTGLAYHREWAQLFGQIMSDEKDIAENLSGKTKKGFNLKKILAGVLTNKKGKTWGLGLIGGILTSFAGLIIGLKLQKSAARAGRYNAKRELESNPENFIGYTPEEYDEVKDVKNTNKKPNTIKEYLLFIPRVLKQYHNYNKYKKTEYKEKQALREILKKQEVTNEQLRDAKNLQRKLFNTFEKVDDNSQVYSESMEAATEIAQPFIWYAAPILALTPLIVFGIQCARGKITRPKALEKITTILGKNSKIMQKKWFKKYLKSVESNVSTVVNNVNTNHKVYTKDGIKTLSIKPVGDLLHGTDFKNDSIVNLINKINENSKGSIEKFKTLSNEEQIEYLGKIQHDIEKVADTIASIKPMIPMQIPVQIDTKAFSEIMRKFRQGGVYKNAANEIEEITIDNKLRNDIIDLITNPQNIKDEGRKKEALKALKMMVGDEKANFLELFSLSTNKIMNSTKTGYETLMQELKKFSQHPNSKISSKTNRLIEFINEINSIKIKDITKLINKKKFLSEDMFKDLKASLEKMSENDFDEFATRLGMPEMTRETAMKVIPKIEQIFKNLPKEELDNIKSKLFEELNKNPDEVLNLIMTGKIKNIFVTPGIKKAVTAAGIAWPTFIFVMTYIMEAWFADMQLKAGRLGVMKAMESLNDPAYYANIEPEQ